MPNDPLRAESLSASLTVRDVATSLAWYADALGFELDRKFERDGRLLAASIRAGTARLLLAQDDGAKGLDRAKGDGFSLMLTTTQDVDAIAARVTATGTALLAEPFTSPAGQRAFRVRDPDGFTLVISTPIVR